MEEPAHHGAFLDFECISYFIVTQTLNFTQNQHRSVNIGQFTKGLVELLMQLAALKADGRIMLFEAGPKVLFAAKCIAGRLGFGFELCVVLVLPLVTVVALSFGGLFSGALITETMFGWRGMGKTIFDAIMGNDFNLALVGLLFATAFTLFGNFLADVCYAWLDPRVSLNVERGS